MLCRAWSNAVGVFWLTRQLKANDVEVRCAAAQVLCALVHPSAKGMCSSVLQSWPEGGSVMMRHGLSRRQPSAFSAAALAFTATSVATSTVDVPALEQHAVCSTHAGEPASAPVQQKRCTGALAAIETTLRTLISSMRSLRPYGSLMPVQAASAGVVDFGREAVLSRGFLWEGLLSRLSACNGQPALACSICALLRMRALCLPDELADEFRLHGITLDIMLRLLDIRQHLVHSLPAGQCDSVHFGCSGVPLLPGRRPTQATCWCCRLATPTSRFLCRLWICQCPDTRMGC
jgi:hypothetical protein